MTETNQPRWLDQAERGVWVRIMAVSQLLPAALDTHLRREANLTHIEYSALATLFETPTQQLQIKELAAHTNSALPRMSRVVSALHGRGLIERVANRHDARATDVRLTDSGRRVLREAAPAHLELVRKTVLEAINPDHASTLITLCDRWLDALDPQQLRSRNPDALPGEHGDLDDEERTPRSRPRP